MRGLRANWRNPPPPYCPAVRCTRTLAIARAIARLRSEERCVTELRRAPGSPRELRGSLESSGELRGALE
eukprot:4280887-Alexandrium_andersonii.AAC.1